MEYFQGNWLYKSTKLSTKIITLNLATLLTIVSSNRASELTYLDIRHIVFKKNSVISHFSKLARTWKKGKSLPSFEWKEFEFLILSGIDTCIFTAHSTRTASVYQARQVGLSLPVILKRGQWTNKATFETFYNKPIVDNSLEILQGK